MVDLSKPHVRYYDVGSYDGETEHRFMFSFYGSEHKPGQSQLIIASEVDGYLRYLRDNTNYQIVRS